MVFENATRNPQLFLKITFFVDGVGEGMEKAGSLLGGPAFGVLSGILFNYYSGILFDYYLQLLVISDGKSKRYWWEKQMKVK